MASEEDSSSYSRLTPDRQVVPDSVRQSLVGGPATIAGIGLGTLVVSVWNFKRELVTLNFGLPGLVAMGLGVTLSFGLLYLAVNLVNSAYHPRQRWTVAISCVGGAVLVTALMFLTIAIRLAEGAAVTQPLFPLVVGTTTGAIAGTLTGNLYVKAVHEAEQARTAREHLSFVNSVLRHDFLNGLAVIKSRAELLALDQDDENVEAILEQSDSIEGLVDRTRATIQALDENETLSTEPVDLTAILRDRLDALSTSFPTATVEADVPDGLAVEATDLLADVIWNLLTNAVEHNDSEDPTISVAVEETDSTVRVRIADDGPGIDGATDDLFKRTLDDDSSTGGFGLFFVYTMMQEYGGSISVEPNEPRGTVFVLELDRA